MSNDDFSHVNVIESLCGLFFVLNEEAPRQADGDRAEDDQNDGRAPGEHGRDAGPVPEENLGLGQEGPGSNASSQNG